MPVNSTHDNQRLLQFLFFKYRKKGTTVYSDFISESPSVPGNWRGTSPDMLISEHHKRIAVCIEEGATFNEKATVLKWKSILDNPNTTLRIIVRDEDESEAIMQLAQRNNIDIECFRVKRSTQRKRKIPPKAGKKGGFRVDWVVIMTSVMIIFVSLLLFGPALMKLFKIQDESRPFETGKQIDQFQKTIDDLKKK